MIRLEASTMMIFQFGPLRLQTGRKGIHETGAGTS